MVISLTATLPLPSDTKALLTVRLLVVIVEAPPVIAACLLLNVLQSVLLKAPRLDADAVGILRVITGVVVPLATLLLTSVPVVPSVSAATLVTVPVLVVYQGPLVN